MRIRHVLSISVILSGALALAIAHGQPATVLGPALGPAPQAKVAAPSASATVAPGTGSGAGRGSAPRSPELTAAIGAGDYCKAMSLGATARDIYDMRPTEFWWVQGNEPDVVTYYYDPVGGVGLYVKSGAQGGTMPLGDPKLPGGNEALPLLATLASPPPPPTPAQLALSQRVMEGLSAEEAARSWFANSNAPPRLASGIDPATARYTRGSDGDVIVLMTSPQGNYQGLRIRNSTGYPGVGKLPAWIDLVAPLAQTERRKQRSEPPPTPLNPGDPPPINCG